MLVNCKISCKVEQINRLQNSCISYILHMLSNPSCSVGEIVYLPATKMDFMIKKIMMMILYSRVANPCFPNHASLPVPHPGNSAKEAVNPPSQRSSCDPSDPPPVIPRTNTNLIRIALALRAFRAGLPHPTFTWAHPGVGETSIHFLDS